MSVVAAAEQQSLVGPNDRLGLTLFLAAAIHGVVILGVSFQSELEQLRSPPSLDVILVQNRTEQAPPEADYLAQANQDGGGSSEDRVRPTTPFSSPQTNDAFGVAPLRVQAASPEKQSRKVQEVLTARFADQEMPTSKEVTTESNVQKNRSSENIDRALEIARLTAEIERDVEAYAKRPRKKFVHARTREAAAAAYMHEWVREIERVGNLNYPDQAARRKLNGSLVLVVGINANGTLAGVILRNSSGHQILDDAAKRIVQLASPYRPFPANLRKDTDILYITRTWQFHSDAGRLVSH